MVALLSFEMRYLFWLSFVERERERAVEVCCWMGESSDHWSFSYTRLKDFFFGVCLTAFHASRLVTHDSVYRAFCAREIGKSHDDENKLLQQKGKRVIETINRPNEEYETVTLQFDFCNIVH